MIDSRYFSSRANNYYTGWWLIKDLGYPYFIMSLYESEKNLNQGRFKNFNFSVCRNKNTIILNTKYPFIEISHLIEWIANNIKRKWSIDFEYASQREVHEYHFYFENEKEASIFKMTFC